MDPLPFQLREAFHLLFLRHLAGILAARSYALKGGVCLRLFYLSPRLSEDVDLDVAGIPVPALRSKIRKLLQGRALTETLRALGVTDLKTSEPKQTETTQRWKVHLILSSGGSLITRLEFSRRKKTISGTLSGVPSGEILRLHQMSPFVCRHYGVEEMVFQKVEALASPSRSACRDLFDLHHLLTHAGPESPSLLPTLPAEILEQTRSKIESFGRKDFSEQVAPFLPADLADLYKEEDAFDRLRCETISRLEGK